MAYSEKVKAAVRSDYVRGLPLKASAASNEVPYDTARSWKRNAAEAGDNWDDARAAARISAGGIRALTSEIIEDFVQLFQTTINDIKKLEGVDAMKKAEAISRLSDAYGKTVKAAGASNPELSRLSIAYDVLQLFAQFIRKYHPDLTDSFMEVLEPFGMELSRVWK